MDLSYPLMVYFICLSHLSSISVYFAHTHLCLLPNRDWNCLERTQIPKETDKVTFPFSSQNTVKTFYSTVFGAQWASQGTVHSSAEGHGGSVYRWGSPLRAQLFIVIAIIVGPSAAALSGAPNSDFPQRKSAPNRYWSGLIFVTNCSWFYQYFET